MEGKKPLNIKGLRGTNEKRELWEAQNWGVVNTLSGNKKMGQEGIWGNTKR